MTTTLHELRNQYGMDKTSESIISRLMTQNTLRYQLRVVGLKVNMMNKTDYIKPTKSRVFDVEEAIEAVITKPMRNYTKSFYQDKLDTENREKAFAQLSKALKEYTKEETC